MATKERSERNDLQPPIEVIGADGKTYTFQWQDVGAYEMINPTDSLVLANDLTSVFNANRGSDFIILSRDSSDLNVPALKLALSQANLEQVRAIGARAADDTEIEWAGAIAGTIVAGSIAGKGIAALERTRVSRRTALAALAGTTLALVGVDVGAIKTILNRGDDEGKYATGHLGNALISAVSDSTNTNVRVLVSYGLDDNPLLPIESMAKGVQNPAAFSGGTQGDGRVGDIATYTRE